MGQKKDDISVIWRAALRMRWNVYSVGVEVRNTVTVSGREWNVGPGCKIV